MSGEPKPHELIASADTDEQFFGHLWALVMAVCQESQPDCTGVSATERKRYRATARRHARYLAARACVRLDDPNAKACIAAIFGE